MPIISATVAVPGNATSVTITGSFLVPYQVAGVVADWLTSTMVSGKTATQFVLTFGTPAPAAGGNVDGVVISPALGGVASDADVANQALTLLGANTIVTLGDGTPNAILANIHYANVRDEVLRAHPWNFAAVRVALVSTFAVPVYDGPQDFTCVFTLPASPYCLRVIESDGDEDGEVWHVEGRTLLYTLNCVKILYTSRVSDPTTYDSLFTAALVLRLAAKLAYPITANATLAATLWNLYDKAIKEARAVDGREGTVPSSSATTFTSVR